MKWANIMEPFFTYVGLFNMFNPAYPFEFLVLKLIYEMKYGLLVL